jgi:hypothetical protein
VGEPQSEVIYVPSNRPERKISGGQREGAALVALATGPQGAPGLSSPWPGSDGNDSWTPGPAGPPGPQGTTGSTGATGSQGPVGPQGPALPGPAGLDADDFGWPIPGNAGPQGVQGPAGGQGPVGYVGVQGDDGDDALPIPGPQGTPGAQGAQGPAGAVKPLWQGEDGDDAWPLPGIQGPQGPAGPGVSYAYYITPTLPLLANFSWYNQNGGAGYSNASSSSDSYGGISITAPAQTSGHNLTGLVQAVPGSTPWTVDAGLIVCGPINFMSVGMILLDSTGGKSYEWGVGYGNSLMELIVVEWNSDQSIEGVLAETTWGGGLIFMRINCDGTNYNFSASYDGVNYFLFSGGNGETSFLANAANKIGFGLNTYCAVNTSVRCVHWNTSGA